MRPMCHGLCATAHPGHTLLLGAQQVAAAGPRGSDASGRGHESDDSNRTLCAVGDQRIERGPLEELYNRPFRTLCTVEDQRIERGSRAAGFLTDPPQPELLRSVPAVHALGPCYQL